MKHAIQELRNANRAWIRAATAKDFISYLTALLEGASQ